MLKNTTSDVSNQPKEKEKKKEGTTTVKRIDWFITAKEKLCMNEQLNIDLININYKENIDTINYEY